MQKKEDILQNKGIKLKTGNVVGLFSNTTT
jgi:hypothetical protein